MTAAAAATARPPVNKWLVTVSITFGTLMGTIDTSIVNVALPHIRGSVGATIEEITWIGSSFALANVLVMPLTAFLGRMFGQKRVYMSCLVLFLVGSVMCGLASSLWGLVAFRALQGFGAGALMPTEQAILRQTFPLSEQGMASAVFSFAVMVGPAIGPTLGGFIVDNYGWPYIFFINLPVGLLGLAMVARFVHEDPEIVGQNRDLAAAQRANIDWAGIVLFSIGLTALQYVLEEGPRYQWLDDDDVLFAAIVSAIGLSAFLVRELTARVPAVDLRLFRDPAFASGTLILLLLFAMLLGNMFILPLFMQELLGFDATDTGIALLPRVLVMMVVTPIVGRVYNHVDPRLLVGLGAVFYCASAYDMSHLTLQSGRGDVISALMLQGVGFALLFIPLVTTSLASIPRHRLADATGLNSLARQVGGSLGLAVFASLLGTRSVEAHDALLGHLSPENPAVQERLHALQASFARFMDPVSAHEASLRALSGELHRQGAVIAFENMFLLAGLSFLLVLPLLALLRVVRSPLEEQPAR